MSFALVVAVLLYLLHTLHASDHLCQTPNQGDSSRAVLSVPASKQKSTWCMDLSQLSRTYNGFTGPHNDDKLLNQQTFISSSNIESVTCQIDCNSLFTLSANMTSKLFDNCQNQFYSYGSRKVDGCLDIKKLSSVQMRLALGICKNYNRCQLVGSLQGDTGSKLATFKSASGRNSIGEAFNKLDDWYEEQMGHANSYMEAVEATIKNIKADAKKRINDYISRSRIGYLRLRQSFLNAIKQLNDSGSSTSDIQAMENQMNSKLKSQSNIIQSNIATFIRLTNGKISDTKIKADLYIRTEKDEINAKYILLQISIMRQSSQARAILKANSELTAAKIRALRTRVLNIDNYKKNRMKTFNAQVDLYKKPNKPEKVEQIKNNALKKLESWKTFVLNIINKNIAMLREFYSKMRLKLVEYVKRITTNTNATNKQIQNQLNRLVKENMRSIKYDKVAFAGVAKAADLITMTSNNYIKVKTEDAFASFASITDRIAKDSNQALSLLRKKLMETFRVAVAEMRKK
ncbi:hypothetical protein AKO1_008934 [Acrasis kona]|uniref:Uncharacterized protein n=1 Tax=Acrasis kona TaxID=1008807 RepID=A0AAW2ZGM4_9EUKA